MFAIHSILPPEYVKCWSNFVEAYSVLLKPVLTCEDVTKRDDKLMHFVLSMKHFMDHTSVLLTCTFIYIGRNLYLIMDQYLPSGVFH